MADINMGWVERLHAPRYIWSQIAAHNPQRGILCREQESQQQLLTWDVETGETRALTPPVPYALNATLSPDGEFVTYLTRHPTHEEVFQYVRVPYAGGTPQPMALTALMYASPHIEEAANAHIGFTAVGGNGYSVQVWTPTSPKPLFSFESEVLAYGPALSADGTIAVVATMHSDTSESTHLEAYNIDTGEKISQLELSDTPLEAVKFAPVLGDTRLLVQAREGLLTRPLVWDVRTGKVDRLPVEFGWDWMDEDRIISSDRDGDIFFVHPYNVREKRQESARCADSGHLVMVYANRSKMIVLFEDIDGSKWHRMAQKNGYTFKEETFSLAEHPQNVMAPGGPSGIKAWGWISEDKKQISFIEGKPRVIGLTLQDEVIPYVEVAAWTDQELTYINASLWAQSREQSLDTYALERLRFASGYYAHNSLQKPLLTAHNMGAALALLALHHDSSLWAGAVVVRPILDWVHLYDNVSPPEKAMLRLWFGGAPTDKPDVWRAASPLRQTTPLTVPVKLLYHPHDTLTPIQHIQTYAANNPSVELIDINRDLVGLVHQQQERLITRMLEAGLPLLTSSSS